MGAYLDGALDEQRARVAAAHLATCQTCQHEADALRRLRALLGRSLDAREPDWTGFWPGIVRGIEERRRAAATPAVPARWRPAWALSGALAAALLVSLTVWEMTPDRTAPEAMVAVNSAATEYPDGSVMVYSMPEPGVTIVWVFGVE